MSGIMNNYFYGKAGQADYTVEQMPTTRKQLFFTTLKVRFSSMVGINLLYFLFMLPLLIWLFMGYETLAIYMGLDENTSDEARQSLMQVEPEVVANYDAYYALNLEYNQLIEKYSSQKGIYAALESEGTLKYEWEEKTEDGETVTKSKDIDRAYFDEKLKARDEGDEKYSERVQHFYDYDAGLTQARNGNILTTLIIAVPLFVIASLGRPGMIYVLRNWARDDHSFVWQDFKDAIKANWKQALALGVMNGLSFVLFFVAWTTYGGFASSGSWLFAIPQGLMLVLLIIWWMMHEIIYAMMVTYEMKLFTLIRNSVLMAIARLPIAFLILLGSVAFPVLISFLPPPFNILALLIIYLLIGFALTGFVEVSFANSCFDKYLNPRIEGAVVNKGLYTPDEEEKLAEAQDEPKELVKEDRYWERKTRK